MQKIRFRLCVVVCITMTIALLCGAIPATAQPRSDAERADAALAERFVEFGQQSLRVEAITEGNWRQSTALFKAATRLNPKEPRFLRLLGESALRVGDTQAAIDAYKALLVLEPGNQVVQIRLVELYASRMETADARLKYFTDIVGKPTIPEEVRSFAAYQAARVYTEKARDVEAKAMLDQALRLNPLNINALAARYRYIAESGTALERVNALLAMLRANPAQPDVTAQLASELANAGLVRPSLDWYALTFAISPRLGQPIAPEYAVDFAAELLIAGTPEDALSILTGETGLLAAFPNHINAWILRLLAEKTLSDPVAYETSRIRFKEVLANRLAIVRQQNGVESATTRPVTGNPVKIPDLTAELAALKESGDPEVINGYASALTDLAWLEIYFNQDASAGRTMIGYLRTIVPADSVVLARLEGWAFLVEGKAEEARVKLSAVAERDPLSQMGLLSLQDPTADETRSNARKLLSNHPSGMMGAMLYEGLLPTGARIVPSNIAEAISDALDAFPRDWMGILDRPETFYAVRADPIQVSHQYGEPLLVQVSIANLSNHDLTIGPGGILRPDLWIDAELLGFNRQQIPGVAFDRLMHVNVLRARQQISQVVRVDQGQLADILSGNPGVGIQIMGSVMMNPITAGNTIAPGPAAYRAKFKRLMERAGSNIAVPSVRQKLFDTLGTGLADHKIRALELLTTYSMLLNHQLMQDNKPDNAEDLSRLLGEFARAVAEARNSTSMPVRAYAAYLSSLLASSPAERSSAVKRMLEDDKWYGRLLGLLAAQALDRDKIAEFSKDRAANDADDIVKAYAQATLQILERATTQPADAPAGQ